MFVFPLTIANCKREDYTCISIKNGWQVFLSRILYLTAGYPAVLYKVSDNNIIIALNILRTRRQWMQREEKLDRCNVRALCTCDPFFQLLAANSSKNVICMLMVHSSHTWSIISSPPAHAEPFCFYFLMRPRPPWYIVCPVSRSPRKILLIR